MSSFTGRGVEIDSDLKAYIRSRIYFALSRFTNRIGRIRVIVDIKIGLLGEIENLCQIRVQILGKPTVAISCSDGDVHLAIAHAADRIHRIVARRINFGWTFAVTEQIDRDWGEGIEEV